MKCKNCAYHSDKCKNMNNQHYNEYRDGDNFCSGLRRGPQYEQNRSKRRALAQAESKENPDA
jgi:hypothetical protein